MPAYNSTISSEEGEIVGNFALLPFHTKIRGPVYPPSGEYDIVEEVLSLFRANCLFRNFEIKTPSDRALIYGILFVSEALNRISPAATEKDTAKALNSFALERFSLPGDQGFPLNSLYSVPGNPAQAETLRAWMTQFRQELAVRLVSKVYENSNGLPSKWWLGFSRRRFMGKSLN
jgi:actin related protein 2/3 complex subunit 3